MTAWTCLHLCPRLSVSDPGRSVSSTDLWELDELDAMIARLQRDVSCYMEAVVYSVVICLWKTLPTVSFESEARNKRTKNKNYTFKNKCILWPYRIRRVFVTVTKAGPKLTASSTYTVAKRLHKRITCIHNKINQPFTKSFSDSTNFQITCMI